jgi:hypothetical protein
MSKNSLPEFGIVKWLDDGLFSTIKLKGCFFNDKEFHYAIRNKICEAKKRAKKLNNQDQQDS